MGPQIRTPAWLSGPWHHGMACQGEMTGGRDAARDGNSIGEADARCTIVPWLLSTHGYILSEDNKKN